MNCDLCNVKATSKKNLDSHLSGKLHQKTLLKQKQNLNESNSKTDNQITSINTEQKKKNKRKKKQCSQNILVDNNNNNDNALDLNTLANDINNNCFSPTDFLSPINEDLLTLERKTQEKYEETICLRPPTFKNLKERKPDHTNKVELIQKRKKSRDEIVKNDLIMADFDIPTPRPHIILLLNQPRKCDVSGLADCEIKAIIDLAYELCTSNMNTNGILSFHTGSWINTKIFHAHLCIDLDEYISLFNESGVKIERFKPNKNWPSINMNKTLNENYLLRVSMYRQEQMPKHKSYLQNSIIEIEKNFQAETNLPNFGFNDQVNLDFCIGDTKIIFKPKNSSFNNINLVKAMVNFAKQLDLFSIDKKAGKGCHICLNILSDSPQGCEGYIHLDPHFIYPYHPERTKFYESIKQIEDYYIET